MNSSLGKMDGEVWGFISEILFDAGILEEEIDIESVYTLEFLNAIYGDQLIGFTTRISYHEALVITPHNMC